MGDTLRRNKYFIFIFLVAVVAIYFFARYMLLQPGDRSKAAPGIPTLSFSVEPSNLQPGDNFDLILQVNPNGASFYAFELYAAYDDLKAELQDTTNPGQNISSSYILVDSSVDLDSNFIKIVGTRTGSPFTGTQNMEIARVSMTVNPDNTDNVSFGWDTETRVGDRLERELQDGTFFLGSSSAGSVGFHLDIPSLGVGDGGAGQVLQGQDLDVEILLKSDNNPVKGFDFVLPYDPSRITFQNTTDLVANIVVNPDSGFRTDLLVKKVEPSENKIYLSMVVPTENGVPIPVRTTEDVHLGTLKLRIRNDAQLGLIDLTPDQSFSMIINTASENILNMVGTVSLEVVAESTLTPTPNPSDTPGFNGLQLQVKLPDVAANLIESDRVQIRALRDGQVMAETTVRLIKYFDYYASLETVNFDSLESGIYDISVKTSTSIGRTFTGVNLTQGGVLQCVGNVATVNCGELLTARDSKPLFSGDSDGFNEQSGSYNKVDSADLQVIAVHFNQPGEGDAAAADFNLDGQVEISDLEIIGKNYGLVGD